MNLHSQEEHTHASTTLKILLLIFALVVTGTLGYMVYIQNHSTTDSGDIVLATKKTTTAPISTADWLTYTNTIFHFSFKYPPSYTVTDALQTNADAQGSGTNVLTVEDKSITGDPALTILVNPAAFDSTPTNLLYTFTVNSDGTLTKKSTAAQAVTQGEFGYDGTRQIAGTNLAGITDMSKTFVIRFAYATNSSSLLTTFDQLIKTFQVTQ